MSNFILSLESAHALAKFALRNVLAVVWTRTIPADIQNVFDSVVHLE